jgi:hypothetical protein
VRLVIPEGIATVVSAPVAEMVLLQMLFTESKVQPLGHSPAARLTVGTWTTSTATKSNRTAQTLVTALSDLLVTTVNPAELIFIGGKFSLFSSIF